MDGDSSRLAWWLFCWRAMAIAWCLARAASWASAGVWDLLAWPLEGGDTGPMLGGGTGRCWRRSISRRGSGLPPPPRRISRCIPGLWLRGGGRRSEGEVNLLLSSRMGGGGEGRRRLSGVRLLLRMCRCLGEGLRRILPCGLCRPLRRPGDTEPAEPDDEADPLRRPAPLRIPPRPLSPPPRLPGGASSDALPDSSWPP
uniref:Putative secreted protein n=1 Tax=Ixodes ricinus TaxID=34613 RepID=A0A6B0V279_IXORI